METITGRDVTVFLADNRSIHASSEISHLSETQMHILTTINQWIVGHNPAPVITVSSTAGPGNNEVQLRRDFGNHNDSLRARRLNTNH